MVGRGDPNLSGRELPYALHTERNDHPIRVLEQLADTLAQKGVKYVDGDIIADDSYFAFERYGEGWSQDDLVWADGAPVSALTINDNVIFVNILPADRAGDRAFVSITPFADYYRIDNRIMTTPAGTGRKIFINREPGATVLTLWGNMPLGDAGANEALAIEDPAEFAAALFRQLLEVRGIAVYGKQKTRHTELSSLSTLTVTASAAARGGDEPSRAFQNQPLVLANYQSKPLIEDVRVINKVSQNLHAEILLRLLGREKGTAGTVEGGLEVLRGFLNQAGITGDQYAFYDGSGLSRQNLVTPQAVVQLLRYADSQPWGPSFRDTLPLSGTDGSLSNRFKDVDVQGRVHAKTGSLGGVKTLSGYATTNHGDRVAFSILSNNFNLPDKRINETIDNIVAEILDDDKEEVNYVRVARGPRPRTPETKPTRPHKAWLEVPPTTLWLQAVRRARAPASAPHSTRTATAACAWPGGRACCAAAPGPVPVGGLRIPSSRSFSTTALLCCCIFRSEQERKILFLAGQSVKFIEELPPPRAMRAP